MPLQKSILLCGLHDRLSVCQATGGLDDARFFISFAAWVSGSLGLADMVSCAAALFCRQIADVALFIRYMCVAVDYIEQDDDFGEVAQTRPICRTAKYGHLHL